MKHFTIFLSLFFCGYISSAAVSHEKWHALLKKHVSEKGNVNYKGFKTDEKILTEYLEYLSANHPNASWNKNDELSYWINAYNAFAIQLVCKHYPVKSIKDIPQAWETPFIKLGDKKYSLNDIEHNIIRKKFDEPRIHFALVCAAVSCPKLLNEAYLPNLLEKQLTKQAFVFINDSGKNKITKDKAMISELFKWYKDDFTKTGTLHQYINTYSSVKINEKTTISYMPYNWNLNE